MAHEVVTAGTLGYEHGPALRTELEMPALYKLSLLLKVFHWMPGSIVYS